MGFPIFRRCHADDLFEASTKICAVAEIKLGGDLRTLSDGKFANDSEFSPAVRDLVDKIADTARQIETSNQKGAEYRRLKKEQKANLRALEQLRREGKIDSVEYNRAVEALRDSTESPEYGGIEESKANLQAQYDAGEISQEDYESAMAELEEVGAEENSGIKYSLSEAIVPTREELENKTPMKVVDISKPQTQGTFAQRRKQILGSVEQVISKPYLNHDTGTMIFLTKNSYTHTFNNLGEIQLNAAEHLPELIENAVLTYAEKATHGDSHADGVYTFFAAAKAGRVYPVKLKVKEYTYSGQDLPKNIKEYFENSPHGYASSYDTVVLEVEEIEKSPTGSVKDMNQIDPFLDPEELSEISIADLLNLVKGESKKYIPKYSLEAPTKDDVIGSLRQYMSGSISKEQMRDIIARVKKNPESEIYGGPAKRPQYSEGVRQILADAERAGMSVRDYISQNIDSFDIRGKLTEDARKALEISGDHRKFSVSEVRENRPPRSLAELDRILAEAEPIDTSDRYKTDFDRWYERTGREEQLRKRMGELVMKSPDESEINSILDELASDLENGYTTPDAALEVVEGLRAETGNDSGVKYSLEGYSEHQKENWANSKRIVIYENDAQFSQFIGNSVSDKTFDKKIYFGAISPELARRIQNDTGLNVEHYNLSLGSNEIRKILKDHGDNESEMLRGQRAVTSDDFLHILDVVLNPTNIKLSNSLYMGKPVIVFTGIYNGRMNIAAVVSDKRLDLFVQTIYVNTKRENLATPTGEQAPINTPEASSGTVFSGDIVSQESENVKSEKQFSVEDIEAQPIEENSDTKADGPAMQNYNRLYEGVEFGNEKIKKLYEQYFPPEAIEYLRGKYRITNEQEAIEAQNRASNLRGQVNRTEERLKLSDEDRALALEILCGDKSISDVESASDKEGLLEYIAVLGEAEVMAEAWRNWRVEKRNQWQKEAEDMYKIFDSSVKGGFKYDKNGNIKTDKRGNPKFQEDATNKAGYKYARETQTRITYDIFSEDKYDEAKAFNDWLFAPERASEAQSNRYKNKMRDRVRKMNLDLKVKKGDTLSEAAAVQLLGELQDIIRRTKRQADMGNADTYRVNGLTYNKAAQSLNDLKKQNPNLDFSENGKLQTAVDKFGQLYAELLSDMNRALVRNGYPPVPARCSLRQAHTRPQAYRKDHQHQRRVSEIHRTSGGQTP